MGDHGNRFGKVRQTNVGEIEDNNPFLFMSVPKNLRRNDTLIDNLRENSKELITHYDIYATMVEIANPSNPRIPDPLIKGSSLFHSLPQPRTCDRLRIPFEYCICRSSKTRLPQNNEIAIPAAKLMVEQMNADLNKYPETAMLCSTLILDEKARIYVDRFDERGDVKIFKVTYSILPSNGKFWGMLSQDVNDKNGTLKILSDKFPRLNAYGPQAHCASQALFASYCFCKDLLNNNM
jgi:hypothetical protein